VIDRLTRSLRAWPAYRWLFVMAAAYFAAAVYGGWFNYVSLHFGSTGIYDLSINQQALSSTIHGNNPWPFYEATNCGRNDRCSFLLVHPVFVAYLVAVPYAMAPSALTLFIIQDLGLAVACFPLFLIARTLTKSSRLALLAAGIYLAWLPAFSGVFSFHWEAFLPLEVFSVFYLFLTERYIESIPIVILTYVTLEIGSVFLFLVGLFFLLPWLPLAPRYLWAEARVLTLPRGPTRTRLAASMRVVRRRLFSPTLVQASLVLMLGSIGAYVVLHLFVTDGGWLLGLPPLPAAYQIPLTQPVHAATFTLANFLYNWQLKLVFWIVMLGTLGFLPLLAPRTAVLWAPWIAYSSLSTGGFYHMGNQYGFLSAAVLFPGFVYGLVRLQRWANGSHAGSPWVRFWHGGTPALSSAQPGAAPLSAGGARSPPSGSASAETLGNGPAGVSSAAVGQPRPSGWTLARDRKRSWTLIGILATGIIVFNIALNPLNPVSASLRSDRPFAAQPNLGITGLPDMAGYHQILELVGMIPRAAVVAVSPDLFTFVTQDPHAFPMVSDLCPTIMPNGTVAPGEPRCPNNFPFSPYSPQFVFLALHASTVLPWWISGKAWSVYTTNRTYPWNSNITSNYSVEAWIPNTYLGGVLLFENNYTGPLQTIGSWSSGVPVTYTATSGLLPRGAGQVAPSASSPGGYTVTTSSNRSDPGTFTGGRVAQTTNLNLMPGNYTITVGLSGSGSNSFPYNKTLGRDAFAENGTVASVRLAGFEYAGPNAHLELASFGSTTVLDGNVVAISYSDWASITISLDIKEPLVALTVIGTNHRNWFDLSINSVTIELDSS
jgi:uncharacterized membrane protein